jgi:hypothetical protein
MVLHPIEAVPGVFNAGENQLPAGKTAELAQIMMGIGN